ncbi:MAG: ATP-binding protein [Bacteroidia bacterium]
MDFWEKIKNDSSVSNELKEEAHALFLSMENENIRQKFIIEKLRENKKITENFLSKTVEEIEEKNKELYQNTREMQRINEQLSETNKELAQFAYIISHDLQEPLRTILNFVELLERKKRDSLDDAAKEYLSFISQSSIRMSNQIRAILEYSRIGKVGSKCEVDCNTLVDDVLTDMSSLVSEKQAVIRKAPLPVVLGYQNELHSLFQNLLSNSLKYSKDDIIPEVYIDCKASWNAWEFSITDNGIGFNPEYRDRIFIIFQRLNHSAKMEGSGIGLSRCKKIIELHDGKIWAESTPGEGSTFYFTIPQMIVE